MTDAPVDTAPETDVDKPAEAKPETKPDESKRSEVPPEVEKALRKANKEAETLRLKLKEYEDANKSEQDKLAEAKAAAEKEAADAKRDYLRLKVGTAKGLPPEVAERLRGDTEEEMTEDADRLLTIFKPGAPTGSADGGNQGKTPASDKQDMNALLREAVKGATR